MEPAECTCKSMSEYMICTKYCEHKSIKTENKSMELKASDLRIGNLVYANNVNEQELVQHRIESVADIDNAHWYWPIPLTPEILVKAGLKGRKDFVYKNDFGVQIKDGKFYLALRNMSGVLFDSIVEVEYLHTLQNWYHLHTKGQELTIDL